jgi:hypothetical protein
MGTFMGIENWLALFLANGLFSSRCDLPMYFTQRTIFWGHISYPIPSTSHIHISNVSSSLPQANTHEQTYDKKTFFFSSSE